MSRSIGICLWEARWCTGRMGNAPDLEGEGPDECSASKCSALRLRVRANKKSSRAAAIIPTTPAATTPVQKEL